MSKTLIVLIVGMLAVGCASTPTMKSVAGTYEGQGAFGHNERIVIFENGIGEYYKNDEKGSKIKWKIAAWEIHAGVEDANSEVFRINKDGSITRIAELKDGKRNLVTD